MSLGTSTKLPLIKYTPADNLAAEPVKCESTSTNFKTVSPAVMVVLPYTNVSSTIIFSPSKGNAATLSGPELKYFTKIVGCSI